MFTVIIFCAGQSLAQEFEQQKSIDNAVIRYLNTVSRQSALYYGKIHQGHPPTPTHPYLKEANYVKASLSYLGADYPEEMLLLDWNRNELVVLSPDNAHIVLFPENLDHAILHGYHVFYLQNDGLPGCPPTGYYIQLYSGKYKAYKKVTARMMEYEWMPGREFSTGTDYVTKTRFYLYKDNAYHIIQNKNALLRNLKPYKKELKKYISNNNLRFQQDAEDLIARTVKEYERLSEMK